MEEPDLNIRSDQSMGFDLIIRILKIHFPGSCLVKSGVPINIAKHFQLMPPIQLNSKDVYMPVKLNQNPGQSWAVFALIFDSTAQNKYISAFFMNFFKIWVLKICCK